MTDDEFKKEVIKRLEGVDNVLMVLYHIATKQNEVSEEDDESNFERGYIGKDKKREKNARNAN